MKFIDCSSTNWCVHFAVGFGCVLCLNISRRELLSSKAKKRLREANASLEKLGVELDKERTKLAQALGEFEAGRSFETTLYNLTGNLTGLEEASVEFHPQILVYSKRLERLEAEVCRSLIVPCLWLNSPGLIDPRYQED